MSIICNQAQWEPAAKVAAPCLLFAHSLSVQDPARQPPNLELMTWEANRHGLDRTGEVVQ